jgi:hypothetical protein
LGNVAREAVGGLRDTIEQIKQFHARIGDPRDAELIAVLESALFRLWLLVDWNRRD